MVGTSMDRTLHRSYSPTGRNLWLLLLSFVAASSSLIRSASAAGPAPLPLDYVRVHGWFMWSAIGLCLPVGIILVRKTKGAIKRGASSRTIQTLVYTHIAIQTLGVAFSIAGGVIAFKKFDNKFRYTHERLGLSLIVLTWMMPITGFLRPERGVPARPIWYGLHWLGGTGVVILGFINIYIGMRIYEYLSSKSLRTLNILFSIQISAMGLIYLIEDRWGYLREQGELSKSVALHSQSVERLKTTQSSSAV